MISEYTKRGKTGFILKTDYRTCLPYFVKWLLPKEPTKEELNAALLKLALDKGWYDDNEEHDIHPVQIPKNQMGIAVKELKAKYPAADGKKIADLVKANLCN